MSATCDICTHDFISRDGAPTHEGARALEELLADEQPEGSWVLVFCVQHGGLVDWDRSEADEPSEWPPGDALDRWLVGTYGRKRLPRLGVGSGYLVRSTAGPDIRRRAAGGNSAERSWMVKPYSATRAGRSARPRAHTPGPAG